MHNKDISDLSNLIDKTNRKLQLSFKREHQYNLEMFEEQLYKEVMYDARPKHLIHEDINYTPLLKKVKKPGAIRNMPEHHAEVEKIIQWPVHKKIPF